MKFRILFVSVLMLLLGVAVVRAQDDLDVWKTEVSLGYNQATGNTRNSQLNAAIDANRKTDADELTVKASTLYSSQNKKMDGQKNTGSIRYAFSFWEKEWYGFYKFAAEHDRFANIDYRIIPSAGIGYWLSDTSQWKAMAEVGLGLEHTEFNDNTKEETDIILIPRGFVEKKIFDEVTISQELVLYPNLDQTDQYRFRAETKFTNPLTENMSLRFSFIDEFNSSPAGDAKKNDTRTILSLVYTL